MNMKRIIVSLMVLLLTVINVKAQLLSYPDNGDIGIPSGYVEMNTQVPQTDFYINPNIDGVVSWSNNTKISYTFSGYTGEHGYANNIYNAPTTCPSLVRKPTQDFASGTDYFATPFGYGGFGFTTNPTFKMLPPFTFKTITVPAHMKPSGAICNKGTVKTWQDKDGIHAQRYAFVFDTDGISPIGETPYRSEILIAGASYYSPNVGANLSMNPSCTFAVAYYKDWDTKNLNYMDLWATVTEWGDVSPWLTYKININKTWNSYVLNNKSSYQMQYSIGSPAISIIDDGKVRLNAVVPKCWKWCTGNLCKVREWFCDNYVMGWDYGSSLVPTIKDIGDNSNIVNNYISPYGAYFKPLNKSPFYSATGAFVVRDQSGGCFGQGANSDCPYYSGMRCSNFGCVFFWAEGEGNFGGDKIKLNGVTTLWEGYKKAYYDDLVFRMTRNDANNTMITQELPMFTKQGTNKFDHWSAGADINDIGHVAVVGVVKYPNGMQTEPLKEQTDVIGNFVNATGAKTGAEFRVFEENIGEQWDSSVAINNQDEVLFCAKSYGTDCGGYGIYCRMYDWNTRLPLTNTFRVNSFNSLIFDTEEDQNTAQSYGEWSFPVSTQANRQTGDFSVTYSYPNYEWINNKSKLGIPASYGAGYEVQSTLLIRKR
jgi:hypothetical protein